MAEKLRPETAASLLRAKAGELEELMRTDAEFGLNQHRATARVIDLTADVALLFSLVAEQVEWLIQYGVIGGPMVPIGDPLFNEDGTPWTAT